MLILIKHKRIEHFLNAGSSRDIHSASWSPELSPKDICGSKLERRDDDRTGASVLPGIIPGPGSGSLEVPQSGREPGWRLGPPHYLLRGLPTAAAYGKAQPSAICFYEALTEDLGGGMRLSVRSRDEMAEWKSSPKSLENPQVNSGSSQESSGEAWTEVKVMSRGCLLTRCSQGCSLFTPGVASCSLSVENLSALGTGIRESESRRLGVGGIREYHSSG